MPWLHSRDDWPYVEPNDLEGIWAQCDPARPLGPMTPVDLADSARRVETAFLSSVCGCILGKPLEISPTLDQLKSAFEKAGEWPIRDYVSEKLQTRGLLRFHGSYKETVRERISWVASDDDINYTIMGMLLLEQHGLKLNRSHIRNEWLQNIPLVKQPLDIFATAMQFVPRRSRFYKVVADSLTEVSQAKDWLDGYYRIHGKFKEYGHCQVYQESGTLINSLRFAENIGDGFCKQVMQGNDTDSYGATAGSILGAFFGPGHLEERWLRPFQDKIHVALATFHEQSLSALAHRMGQLPAKIAAEQATVVPSPL